MIFFGGTLLGLVSLASRSVSRDDIRNPLIIDGFYPKGNLRPRGDSSGSELGIFTVVTLDDNN